MGQTDESGPHAARASASLALAVAILGVLAYRASFTVPFALDDGHAIVGRAEVHADSLDPRKLWRATHGVRPLAYLSFAVNHALGGLDPVGYHAVNLAFHLGAAWLVFLVASRLLAVAAADLTARSRFRVAAVTALLFAVHPVHTQAVTYVVQRMASMGGFFGFLSTLAWLQARTRTRRWVAWLAGATGAWLLALFCKENYVVLPAVLAAADALLFGWPRGLRRRWPLLAAGAAALLAVAGVMLWRTREVIANMYQRFGVSPVERLLTEPAVIWHYLSLLVLPLPSRLSVAYDWPVARSLVAPWWTLPAIAGLGALVWIAWRMRRRWPLLAFAVLWWLGNLVVESSLIPLDLAFEHRIYFPSLGPLLLAAWAIENAALRLRASPWTVAAPAIGLLAFATDRRNLAWNDPLLLLRQAAEHGNASREVLRGIATESYARGDAAGARSAAERVLARAPEDALALTTLGHVALDDGETRRAEGLFERAIAANADEPGVWFGLAQSLSLQGRAAEAEPLLVRRLGSTPGDVSAWIALGVVRGQRGDRAGAHAALDRAIALRPDDPLGWRYRAALFLSEGDPAAALRDLERALALRRDDADVRVAVGDALAALGRGPEARAAWERALALDPRNGDARRRLSPPAAPR